jgi:type II secretory pathway pseudopilin PulG
MSPTPICKDAGGGSSRSREEGFTLAALIVILTIISVVVAFTVPDQWSMIMTRERDRQTIYLMRQWARAVLTFQEKHKVLPSSLEQMVEARRPRVLRQGLVVCPLTGEEDWILVPPQAVTGAPVVGAAGGPVGPPDNIPSGADRFRNPNFGGSTAGNRGLGSSPQIPPGQPQPGQAGGGGSRLNPQLSPKDYKGQFVGVRPNKTGKALIALNGIENYEEWVFTWQDLRAEIDSRNRSLYKQ